MVPQSAARRTHLDAPFWGLLLASALGLGSVTLFGVAMEASSDTSQLALRSSVEQR